MKKGLSYISERTSQWRYADNNKEEKWLEPLTEYTALCEIKRGQPVSVATKEDIERFFKGKGVDDENISIFTDKLLQANAAFVTLTNPLYHTHTIGLAMEYSAGVIVTADDVEVQSEKIHILTNGQFEYDFDYAKKAFHLDDAEIAQTEYFPSFFDGFNLDVIGKTVYIQGSQDGVLTINTEDAYLAYNNVIVLGHITDINSNDNFGIIQVQIEGDDRGVIDNTQIEAQLGEDVTISQDKAVRVFALGEEDDSTMKFKLSFTLGAVNTECPGGYIALQRMDGCTHYIYINSENFERLPEDLAFEGIANYYKVTTNSEITKSTVNYGMFTTDQSNTEHFIVELKNALSFAISSIAYYEDNMQIVGLNGVTHNKISGFNFTNENVKKGSFIFDGEADACGGFYDIYISENLRRYFGLEYIEHGSYFNKGYAILADIRNAHRQNILGVYNSKHYGEHIKKLDKAVFIRQGTFDTPVDQLQRGAVYYLSSHGRITTVPQIYYNSIIKVGMAQTESKMILDLTDCRQYNIGELPVGYMKPSVGGEAEYGFLLMDGKTPHRIDAYQELYDALSQYYPANQLHVQDYFFAEGAADGYADNDNHPQDELAQGFIIPEVIYHTAGSEETKTVAGQIKWLVEGVYKEMPRAPFIRREGIINEEGIPTVGSFDITSLIIYGPDEERIQSPELENLDIKLFVDFDYIPGKSQKHNWTELTPGFHTINNFDYYGYKWAVRQIEVPSAEYPYGKWALDCVVNGDQNDIEDTNTTGLGKGLRYARYPLEEPQSLNGKYFRIYIAKREYFQRQFNVESLFKTLVKEDIEDLTGKPWVHNAVSGAAVRDDIQEEVFTNHLVVKSGERNNMGKEATVDVAVNHFNFEAAPCDSNAIESDLTDHNLVKADIRFLNPAAKDYNQTLDFFKGFLQYHLDTNEDNEKATTAAFYNSIKKNNFNLVPYGMLKEHEDLVSGKIPENSTNAQTPHGLDNRGYYGNLDAKTVAGVYLGIPGSIYERQGNTDDPDNKYKTVSYKYEQVLPFLDLVRSQDTGKAPLYYNFTIGSHVTYIGLSNEGTKPEVIFSNDYKQDTTSRETTVTTSIQNGQALVYKVIAGTEQILDVTVGEVIDLHGKKIKDSEFTTSTIQAKDLYREYLRDKVKALPDVMENITVKENADDIKLDSALEVLYEMPLAEFKYKHNNYIKNYFGIITEQIANAVNNFKGEDELTTDALNLTAKDIKYTYSDAEKAMIAKYMPYVTDDNDKAQNILSTVGILLKAAQETQARLLSLETSTFGDDTPTQPGYENVENYNAQSETLAENQNNTMLGLNRLVKMLCKEVFQDANPSLDVASTWSESDQYSRIDFLDKKIHGEAAEPSNGDTRITLNEKLGETYPDEVAIEKDRAKAYTVTKDVVEDGIDFKDEEQYLKEKVDKQEAQRESGKADDFDGIHDTLNRVLVKLNRLTESINGEDNINVRPKRLDIIRDNIETIITELYQDGGVEYSDTDEAQAPFVKGQSSRIDKLLKQLFDYKLVLKGEKNLAQFGTAESKTADFSKVAPFSTQDKDINDADIPMQHYVASARTFNGKQLLGDAAFETNLGEGSLGEVETFEGVAPQRIDDFKYATILDIIIDFIIGEEKNLVRGNVTANPYDDKEKAATYRNNETLFERIVSLEEAMDKIAMRFRNADTFEKDNGKTEYEGINSVDDFVNSMSGYLGIKQKDGKTDTESVDTNALWESDLTTTPAENIALVGKDTKFQPAMYDAVKRIRQEEYNTKTFKNILGKDYNNVLDTNSHIKEAEFVDSFNKESPEDYEIGDPEKPTYTVSSDMEQILKLLWGGDGKDKTKDQETHLTSYGHFAPAAGEAFTNAPDNGVNVLEYLFNTLYKLPRAVMPTDYENKSLTDNDKDHCSSSFYDIDSIHSDGRHNSYEDENKEYLGYGHRLDAVQLKESTSNFAGATFRKNRFEMIEDSIVAIRKFLGIDQLLGDGKYSGVMSVSTENDCVINGKDFATKDVNSVMNYVVESRYNYNVMRAEVGSPNAEYTDNKNTIFTQLTNLQNHDTTQDAANDDRFKAIEAAIGTVTANNFSYTNDKTINDRLVDMENKFSADYEEAIDGVQDLTTQLKNNVKTLNEVQRVLGIGDESSGNTYKNYNSEFATATVGTVADSIASENARATEVESKQQTEYTKLVTDLTTDVHSKIGIKANDTYKDFTTNKGDTSENTTLIDELNAKVDLSRVVKLGTESGDGVIYTAAKEEAVRKDWTDKNIAKTKDNGDLPAEFEVPNTQKETGNEGAVSNWLKTFGEFTDKLNKAQIDTAAVLGLTNGSEIVCSANKLYSKVNVSNVNNWNAWKSFLNIDIEVMDEGSDGIIYILMGDLTDSNAETITNNFTGVKYNLGKTNCMGVNRTLIYSVTQTPITDVYKFRDGTFYKIDNQGNELLISKTVTFIED